MIMLQIVTFMVSSINMRERSLDIRDKIIHSPSNAHSMVGIVHKAASKLNSDHFDNFKGIGFNGLDSLLVGLFGQMIALLLIHGFCE